MWLVVMKIISWIVWCLGEASKKVFICRDFGIVKAGWVALQETKLCSVDCCMVNQVCGCNEWGYAFFASSGAT